jgi:hypothetical protein
MIVYTDLRISEERVVLWERKLQEEGLYTLPDDVLEGESVEANVRVVRLIY